MVMDDHGSSTTSNNNTVNNNNNIMRVQVTAHPDSLTMSSKYSGAGSIKSSDLSSQCGETTISPLASVTEMLPPTSIVTGSISTRRTTLRIRVSNEISERSKDLVVDISNSINLYSAVYDAKSVKEAHVRKWGPEIVQKVKNGTAKIQCAIWDDNVGRPCHTFSIEELKQTTTEKLYELVPEMDLVKLVLRCSDNTAATDDGNGGPSVAAAPSLTMGHPPLASMNMEGISRCPFSGVEFSSELLEQFTQKMRAQRNQDSASDQQSSHEDTHPNQSTACHPIGESSTTPDCAAAIQANPTQTSLTNTQDETSGHSLSAADILLPSSVAGGLTDTAPSILHVRVTNPTSKRSVDLSMPLHEQTTLMEAIYDNPLMQEAEVRTFSTEIMAQIHAGTTEIHLSLLRQGQPIRFYTLGELRTTSTQQFYQDLFEERVRTTDVVCLELIALPMQQQQQQQELRHHQQESMEDEVKERTYEVPLHSTSTSSGSCSNDDDDESDLNDANDRDHISEMLFSSSTHLRQDSVPLELFSNVARHFTDPSLGDTLHSLDLDLDCHSEQLSVPLKQTLRIRISNRTTHRFKDLVVDIRDDLNLHDAIYDNKGVKDAHVRKWGPQMVQDVKQGLAEIHVVVWDDDSARPWRVFRVEELKRTSTRDLYESVPESCDLVKLFLECVRTKQQQRPPHVLRIENGKPQSVMVPPTLSSSTITTLRSCKSESYLKNGASRRTRRRLNHMTLSSTSNGSTTSTLSERLSATLEPPLSLDFWSKLANGSDHNCRQPAGRPPRRKNRNLQSFDIDNYLVRSKKIATNNGRSLSSSDLRGNLNETWSKSVTTGSTSRLGQDTTLSAKVQRFLQLSEGKPKEHGITSESSQSLGTSHSSSLEGQGQPNVATTHDDKWKEFLRLCNAKKSPSLQSIKNPTNRAAIDSLKNAEFPTIVRTLNDKEEFLSRVSSITLQERRPNAPPLRGIPNATFQVDRSAAFYRPGRLHGSNSVDDMKSLHEQSSRAQVHDRINRFLQLSQGGGGGERKPPSESAFNKVLATSESMLSLKSSLESLRGERPVMTPKHLRSELVKVPDVTPDIPPIAEIEVIKGDEKAAAAGVGISLSPELVKEVFPYHVVLSSDFRILQVGNRLGQLIDEESLVGKVVSDVFMITSPIPMFGKWDWNIMDKMRDKTIFLESVLTNSSMVKAKIKGTIIEISSSPRTVMLALFPNVKNLSELEEMNLSMGDLPLHSCQREAVLLGEHSKSEVKLTNHLDQLHRELINSMEKQIEDRTNELATANEELERANSQLAIQSARQLEHFACMSHEIRTPLNCIVGMSSLLLDDADVMDPMHADSIRMINTSGDLLKAVVDDVLDYAKLESGSFEVDIKPTNLQETLASVVHSISQRVQEKNIRLRTHYSPTLPLVLETDSRRLQQVLFNLLGNAGKFSKPNSVIDLSVTLMTGPLKQEEGQPVQYSPSGQIIRFSVMDYGKGIDKKDFTTIFEPFSQASKETQNIYGGTGLGLSITSKLVHRLGGTVGLDSEPGKYAEFTVDLPFCGTAVNVESVKMKMAGTTLIVVEPERKYDYSFTKHTIKPEPIPFDEEVTKLYALDVARCTSLDDAVDRLFEQRSDENTRHFALLVHETLFDTEAKDILDTFVKPSEYTLMTFGPNFSVEMTKESHLKSLLGVFPATLLETIAFYRTNHSESSMIGLDGMTDSCEGNSFALLSNQSDQGSKSDQMGGSVTSMSSEFSEHLKGEQSIVGPLANFREPESMDNQKRPLRGGLFASLSRAADQGKVGPSKDTSPKPTPKTVDGLFSSRRSESAIELDRSGHSLHSGMSGRRSGSTSITLTSDSNLRRIPPTRRSPMTASPKRSLKVMYAEDNVVNQKVLSKMLSRAGIEDITIVDNGKKAVDACETQQFDVIFMDYEMPIMDGMEATKLIVDRHPDANVIFVTAHALEEFKNKARSVGAAGFFSKPVRATDIESVLDELETTKQRKRESGASDVTMRARKSDYVESVPMVVETQAAGSTGNPTDQHMTDDSDDMPMKQATDDSALLKDQEADIPPAPPSEHVEDTLDVLMSKQATIDPPNDKKLKPVTRKETQGVDPSMAVLVNDDDSALRKGMTRDPVMEMRVDTLTPKRPSKTQRQQGVAPVEKEVRPLFPLSKQSEDGGPGRVGSVKPGSIKRYLKVLYAEDNVVNQKVLAKALERAGVRDITMVSNGKAAVEICQTIHFDCIFMDVEMPIMGGLEACQRIVDHDDKALVVFVTAHDLAEFKAKATKVGSWDCLSKPFRLGDIDELLDRVEAACGKSHHETLRPPMGGTSHSATTTGDRPAAAAASGSALPVASQSSSSSSSLPSTVSIVKAKTPSQKRNKNLKVLYAEDNVVNQKVLSRVLNRAGITDITIVDNGKTAVELCQTVKYSCVFLDMQMPVMDGIEACKQIVKNDPESIVIFVTAHALDEFKAQAVSIGAKSFISKPFRLSDIQKVLDVLNLE